MKFPFITFSSIFSLMGCLSKIQSWASAMMYLSETGIPIDRCIMQQPRLICCHRRWPISEDEEFSKTDKSSKGSSLPLALYFAQKIVCSWKRTFLPDVDSAENKDVIWILYSSFWKLLSWVQYERSHSFSFSSPFIKLSRKL